MCTTDAELISTEENQECATVHKCHQKHFVLVLEQRKKKVFSCCNATDSRSHGGILNHAEAIVSLPFFFSLSTSKPLHSFIKREIKCVREGQR